MSEEDVRPETSKLSPDGNFSNLGVSRRGATGEGAVGQLPPPPYDFPFFRGQSYRLIIPLPQYENLETTSFRSEKTCVGVPPPPGGGGGAAGEGVVGQLPPPYDFPFFRGQSCRLIIPLPQYENLETTFFRSEKTCVGVPPPPPPPAQLFQAGSAASRHFATPN